MSLTGTAGLGPGTANFLEVISPHNTTQSQTKSIGALNPKASSDSRLSNTDTVSTSFVISAEERARLEADKIYVKPKNTLGGRRRRINLGSFRRREIADEKVLDQVNLVLDQYLQCLTLVLNNNSKL